MVDSRTATDPGPRLQEAQRDQELLWIERALGADEQAFRCLVERHQRGVFRLVMRLIVSKADVDDLVQETFARAYCALSQFDPRFRFSTWLYRIALNLCRDHVKSAKRRERPVGIDLELSSELPGEEVLELRPDERARLLRLQRALASLSPQDREVIVLKDLHELAFEEVRQVTGGSIASLKIRALRARTRLAALMEGQEP